WIEHFLHRLIHASKIESSRQTRKPHRTQLVRRFVRTRASTLETECAPDLATTETRYSCPSCPATAPQQSTAFDQHEGAVVHQSPKDLTVLAYPDQTECSLYPSAHNKFRRSLRAKLSSAP